MKTGTERFLTPADLADVFGVPESKVMQWRRAYQWPHVKIGRKFRFTVEQVEAIKRAHTVQAGQIAATDGRTQRSAGRKRAS